MIRPMHAVVVAALVIAAVALSTRDFLDLEIPVASHEGGGAFWWESHRTELAYDDSPGVFYVRRQVGTASANAQHWQTGADVFAFFDRQLAERGWTLTSTGGSDPAVPETRLLPAEGIHRYYRPDDSHVGSPYIIVAVWPVVAPSKTSTWSLQRSRRRSGSSSGPAWIDAGQSAFTQAKNGTLTGAVSLLS